MLKGLIERKVDLLVMRFNAERQYSHEIGLVRVRLGADNELIKPIWIQKNDQMLDSKLAGKRMLDDCRSGFLYSDNP